jgi:hypothetical protein
VVSGKFFGGDAQAKIEMDVSNAAVNQRELPVESVTNKQIPG